jgi:hypothetical protein
MISHAVIILGIDPELLFLVPALNTTDFIIAVTIPDKLTMNGKIVLSVPDILTVDQVKIAFGKRQVIDGIQQIGFTGTVPACETVNFFRKPQRRLTVIFKIV